MPETSCLEAFCPAYTKMKVKCCFCPVVFNIINKPVAKEKVFAFSIRDHPKDFSNFQDGLLFNV